MIGRDQFPWNAGSRTESFGAQASTLGLNVTAGGSSNTKGSWVTIVTATSFAYNLVTLQAFGNNFADDYVVDLGIEVGGNTFVIAEDLRIATQKRLANDGTQNFWLPLHIPAGAKLNLRVASIINAGIYSGFLLQGFSGGIAGMRGFSRCRSLYTVSGSTGGIVVDPGGTANTKGSYVQLIASSGFASAMLMVQVGVAADIGRAAAATLRFDLATGAGGSEQILISDVPMGWSTGMDAPMLTGSFMFPFFIPEGSRIAARTQCSIITAGDRLIDLAAWGFEP